MILRERPIPIQLLQREALIWRVPKTFSRYKDIERDHINWKAGFSGERNVDYFLSYLPEDQYIIINDLRLKYKNTFQIDTLILSHLFGLALEIKNISGTLFFDKDTNGMTRTYKDIVEGMANPLIQARRHRAQLINWMTKQKQAMPIEYLVIISKNSTILKTNPGNEHIFERIVYAECLEEKVSQLAARYHAPALKGKALNKFCDLLLAENIPDYPDILKTYSIPKSDVKPGVQCLVCKRIPMMRVSASWYCPFCKTYSKDAHIPAVRHYFLLMNEPMTLKQFQEFLLIEQRGVAKNLLHSLNIPSTGTRKTTQYYLPPDCILSPLKENDMKKGEILT